VHNLFFLFIATQLTVLFDEKEVSNTNKIVMDTSQPITQQQVVARVRRHLSMVRTYTGYPFAALIS
jgi:hypothetical protein